MPSRCIKCSPGRPPILWAIRDGIDIAIRYGEGNYDKVTSQLLAEEDVSPELLQGDRPLRRPEDLRHRRLIHDNLRID